MTKPSRLSPNSDSDDTPPSDAAPAYAVGYGRPPAHTRFKPGHAGRGGRPKGQRNSRTVIEGFLKERVTLVEGKRQRTMSKHDAMYLRIVNAAVSGDHKAQSKIIALTMGAEPSEPAKQERFTLTEEVLERLSPGTLTELTRVVTELDAEKKKLH